VFIRENLWQKVFLHPGWEGCRLKQHQAVARLNASVVYVVDQCPSAQIGVAKTGFAFPWLRFDSIKKR
jgi:hypothetical protein